MSIGEGIRDGRIGRVPIWAIGVIIAGGIVLFLFIRNRKNNEAVDSDYNQAPVNDVSGLQPADFADSLSNNFPQQVSLAPLPERPETNAQWLIAAFDFLVGQSKDPVLVQRALQKYLAGQALSGDERDLIRLATANSALSLPPEGVNLEPLPPVAGENPPGGSPPVNTVPTHVPPKMNYDLYTWVTELNAEYPGYGITFVKLFGNFVGDPTALNPTARNYMSWSAGPAGSNYKIPKFTKTPPSIRIR